MFAALAEALYNKGVIVRDMEIEATYQVACLGGLSTISALGCFMVQKVIKQQDGEIILQSANVRDGANINIKMSQVEKIDGMTPERFAAVYNVDINGGAVKTGKRRGRKSKYRGVITIG